MHPSLSVGKSLLWKQTILKKPSRLHCLPTLSDKVTNFECVILKTVMETHEYYVSISLLHLCLGCISANIKVARLWSEKNGKKSFWICQFIPIYLFLLLYEDSQNFHSSCSSPAYNLLYVHGLTKSFTSLIIPLKCFCSYSHQNTCSCMLKIISF